MNDQSNSPRINNPIDLERISTVIGCIYDCAIDPKRWVVTLESICEACSLSDAALALQSLPSGQLLLSAAVDGFDGWRDYALDSIALWGGPERIQRLPLNEPILHSSLEGLPPRKDNRYFTEYLQPRGLIDAIAIGFARSPTMLGTVGFNRHSSNGPIGEYEMAFISALAPHFQRAAIISKLLDVNAVTAQTFEAMLNRFTVSVVLVDDELRIIHANSSAEKMLAAGDPILSVKGKLATQSPLQNSVLQTAVSQAAILEQELGHRGIGIPLKSRTGIARVIHVLPLSRGDLRPTLRQGAKVALFIASADSPVQMPRDALALLYDLTTTEAQIFQRIVEGLSPSEIATSLGVAISTVRTHLQHVFTKTSTSRQSELINLANQVSMPF